MKKKNIQLLLICFVILVNCAFLASIGSVIHFNILLICIVLFSLFVIIFRKYSKTLFHSTYICTIIWFCFQFCSVLLSPFLEFGSFKGLIAQNVVIYDILMLIFLNKDNLNSLSSSKNIEIHCSYEMLQCDTELIEEIELDEEIKTKLNQLAQKIEINNSLNYNQNYKLFLTIKEQVDRLKRTESNESKKKYIENINNILFENF